MDLRGYLRAMRKSWWLILIMLALGASGGEFLNVRATPLYQSEVTFYVSTPTEAAGGNAYQANQYALSKIGSYTRLATSDRLAGMIIAKTGLDMTTPAVAGELSATSSLNTVLVTVYVTDPSSDRSLVIARAVASEFGTLVDDLDNRNVQGSVGGSTVVLNVISGPTQHKTPVSPKTRANLTLGVIAGLLVGLALALLRSLLDTTLRSLDDLRHASLLPVLGSLTYDSTAKKSPILVGEKVRSNRAEMFRQLRTNLQFMDVDNPVSVLVVTSSVSSEGKSTTATNLAMVYAETGRRVLLVEADMRKPQIAEYLGLDRAVGLSDILAGHLDVQQVMQQWGTDGLQVLLCGSIPPNPSELLGSQNMVNLIERLRGLFDILVVDTPPLLPVTDGAVASTWADGVVLVVRAGRTSRTQVAASLDALATVDARVLGTVLSMGRSKATVGADAYYSYDQQRLGKRVPFKRRSESAGALAAMAAAKSADREAEQPPDPSPEVISGTGRKAKRMARQEEAPAKGSAGSSTEAAMDPEAAIAPVLEAPEADVGSAIADVDQDDRVRVPHDNGKDVTDGERDGPEATADRA